MTSDDLTLVVDEAIGILKTPGNGVVRQFCNYLTDRLDDGVKPGDPNACKFCASGVLRHAAMRVRRPGEVAESLWSVPLSFEDEVAIAGNYGTVISMFAEAWNAGLKPYDDGSGFSFDPEVVRLRLIGMLHTARGRLTKEMTG